MLKIKIPSTIITFFGCVLNRYQDTLKPMHQQFIEPTKNFADIIIPNDRYNTVAIDIVRTVINERL